MANVHICSLIRARDTMGDYFFHEGLSALPDLISSLAFFLELQIAYMQGELNSCVFINCEWSNLLCPEYLINLMRKQKSCCNQADPYIFYILILLIRHEWDCFERHLQSAKLVFSACFWVFRIIGKCLIRLQRWELIMCPWDFKQVPSGNSW